jgi:hypothetical protein
MPKTPQSPTRARGDRPAADPPGGSDGRVLTGGIRWDTVDIRDRIYEPTLAPLPAIRLPAAQVVAALATRSGSWRLVPRSQGPGDEGTCAGQALAALIDIQRLSAQGPDIVPVSARMLHWTARLTTTGRGPADQTAGVSLREVIKAFYNYGVCTEADWPYRPGDPRGALTVARAKAARAVVLGAYYRMRPNLNSYHAALTESGALLVAAELHDGWLPVQVSANAGQIVPPPPGAGSGMLGLEKHAFVILGYTPEGFLVLNSWGPDWGGWQSPGPDPVPYPGIALWRYADWANTIVDGWVLQLGIGGDGAFDFSIGDMGLGFVAEALVRSTPVYSILGHFMHLDDGRYAETGNYVSSPASLEETTTYLCKADPAAAGGYQGVLLTFAGGLLGLRAAAEQTARVKPLVRDSGWYPFTVLFCVDGVPDTDALLALVFDEARARLGQPGPAFDRFVETRVHHVGRALWRDLLRGARTAALPDGPFHDLARAWVRVTAERPDFRLRIIAESEGVFGLAALVQALGKAPFQAEAPAWFAALDSVDLIAPPLCWSEYRALAAGLDAGWGPGRATQQISVHAPDPRDAGRLRVPPYGGSWFDLIQRGFLGRVPAAGAPAPGGEVARARVAPVWLAWQRAPRTRLVPIGWPAGARSTHTTDPITQTQLVYASDVRGRLLGILKRRSPSRRPRAERA